MANIKFSGFTEVTSISGVQEIVGYNGTQNVRITPANLLSSLPGGPFLPLAGGTMTGDLLFDDGVVAKFGTGQDLRIQSIGDQGYIQNYTGHLHIVNLADDKDILFRSDDGSGGIATYFYLDGSDVITRVSRDFRASDNIKLQAGSSGDLQIYHDGTHSIINNSTGILYINGPTVYLRANQNENAIICNANGSVDLYYDGSASPKLLTTLTGIEVEGDVGINTASPVTFLDVRGNDTALPATSGTTVSTGTRLRLASTAASTLSASLDIGIGTSSRAWIQSTSIGDLSDGNRLLLNPNGGNVGIGEQTPLYPLSIKDNAVIGTNKTVLQLQSETITNGGSMNLDFRVTSSNAVDRYVARITGVREGNGALSQLQFWTEDSGLYQRMTILSGGNVGIGTASPRGKLDIVGNTDNDTDFLTIQDDDPTANSHRPSIRFRSDTAQIGQITSLDNSMRFSVGTTETSLLEIASSGNVGIGTTSPTVALDVLGTNNLSSRARFTKGAQTLQFGAARDTTTVPFIGSETNHDFSIIANNTERMRITSGGVVGVGTDGLFSFGSGSESGTFIQQSSYMGISIASGQTAAFILRRLEDGTLQRFYNSNTVVGSISVAGSATGYNTSSDYRLKEDLKDFDGLDKVSKIPVYDFKWKVDDSRSYGVMAHELEEVLPNAVSGEKDGEEMQGVDYSKIVPLLVKSIQELSAKVTALENS